jgi:solute carrier family 13 (sodium-dependent dicarboxylate transporter), member 2/3/5
VIERRELLRRRIGLLAGPLAFAAILATPSPPSVTAIAWRTAAVAALMAVWWISEAIPIPATALVPLVLFPSLGILPIERAAAPFANPVIFLFLGGFILAAAVERSGLHRRLALSVVRGAGTTPRAIVGGFMLATALISMWVSNTATVVMMLPIALSVVRLLEGSSGRDTLAVPLMLGIAYSASIGGLGTLIGTPPNALLAGFASSEHAIRIGFAQWMVFAVPLVVVTLPLVWLYLVRVQFRLPEGELAGGREMIGLEIARLGAVSRAEKSVAAIALLTAACWVTQPLLARVAPGISDATIAIAGGLLMFVVPLSWRNGESLLEWPDVERIPWGVLVLFGGGLSLARAIDESGLAAAIAHGVAGSGGVSIILLTLAVTATVIFLTELTSNTAVAAAFLPILGSIAVGFGHSPLVLAIPAALAASCAFMLPVATPPNAIVYASGRLTIPQMARAGLALNLFFVAAITLAVFALAPLVFAM